MRYPNSKIEKNRNVFPSPAEQRHIRSSGNCTKNWNLTGSKRIYFPNLWFGGNVHVAGLVTGSDLLTELQDKSLSDPLLIPKNMLRETEDVFLDGMLLSEVERALGVSIRTFSDGTELILRVFEE